jgi:hypothetical protein
MRWILILVNNYSLDSELIADWIELNALSKSDNASGFDKLRLESAELLELPAQRIDVALNVIKRRFEILRDDYPIEIKSVGMVRRSNWETMPYTFLLRISSGFEHAFSYTAVENTNRAESFENIVVFCLKNLLGRDAKAIRFGFPSGDRPVEFPKAIEWLSARMGVSSGQAYRPPRRKDGGVDVVAWRPFKDRRNGFPVYLVQATCERNFSHKVFDIDLRLWSGWLSLDVDPHSVLAVPTTISPGEEWNDISSRVVILERIRICELLAISRTQIFVDSSEKKLTWTIREGLE